MDVRCPDCKIKFSLAEELDDGDILNCPECNLELVAVKIKKKIKVKSSKEYFLDEADEFDDAFEEDELEE